MSTRILTSKPTGYLSFSVIVLIVICSSVTGCERAKTGTASNPSEARVSGDERLSMMDIEAIHIGMHLEDVIDLYGYGMLTEGYWLQYGSEDHGFKYMVVFCPEAGVQSVLRCRIGGSILDAVYVVPDHYRGRTVAELRNVDKFWERFDKYWESHVLEQEM